MLYLLISFLEQNWQTPELHILTYVPLASCCLHGCIAECYIPNAEDLRNRLPAHWLQAAALGSPSCLQVTRHTQLSSLQRGTQSETKRLLVKTMKCTVGMRHMDVAITQCMITQLTSTPNWVDYCHVSKSNACQDSKQ